jgi:hypothetical protein
MIKELNEINADLELFAFRLENMCRAIEKQYGIDDEMINKIMNEMVESEKKKDNL